MAPLRNGSYLQADMERKMTVCNDKNDSDRPGQPKHFILNLPKR